MGGAPLEWETFMREHVERRPTEQSLLYHVDLGERLRLLLIAAAYDAEAVLHARCELVEQSAPKALPDTRCPLEVNMPGPGKRRATSRAPS